MSAAQYSPLGAGGWHGRSLCRRWRRGGLLCALIALVFFSLITLYCSGPVLRQAQAHHFICYPIFDWSQLVMLPRYEQMNVGIRSLVGDMAGEKINPVSSKTELVQAEMTEGQNIVLGPNMPTIKPLSKQSMQSPLKNPESEPISKQSSQSASIENPASELIYKHSRQSPSKENQYKKTYNDISKKVNLQINNVRKEYKYKQDFVGLKDPNKIVLAKPKTFENFGGLKRKIERLNQEQFVMNIDKFGPLTNDSVVIVIQAHKRVEYFRELIKALENNKFISDTLIVVSHGFYSSDMNAIVKNIKFTRVLQIFFPFSLQTHPKSFPGISPEDCPRHFTKKESEKRNCTWSPRNAEEQQLKHHWWWKASFVFEHLRITRHFNGLVFFLEEDHYVFPDSLHMLKLMRAIAPKECPECNILGLGLDHGSVSSYTGLSHKLLVVQWNNLGFAFDREFWKGLSSGKCANMFCEYNDNNWDFTLAYLSHRCLPHKLKPLNVRSSRVFHIGDCGTHFHNKKCSAMESLRGTKELEAEVLPYLFPTEVKVINTQYMQMSVDGCNGGWSDPRDVALCKTFVGVRTDNNVV